MTRSLLKPKQPEVKTDLPRPKGRLFAKAIIPISLLIAVLGGGISWYFLSSSGIKPLTLSGRIEGYETNIGAKVAGRVAFVAVREGDEVKQGQMIVRMDDDEIQAQLKGASARLIAAQQEERQAYLQIAVLESQIQELQLNLQQAQGDTKGQILQAESAVAASIAQLNQAQAQLQQAQAELKLTKTDRDRYADLMEKGVIPRQQFDRAQTAWEMAQATVKARQASVEAANKQVQVAQGQLQQAKTTALNPDIRQAQLQGLRTQLAQTRLKLAATQAEVENSQASQQEVESKIADLNIVSPLDGVVVTRSVEPGVVVTPGKILLTLINPDEVYLRGFMPEGEIGQVRIGQTAKIFLDSAPKQPLDGTVSAIDTQASFTPENIYFKEDRVKQVFGVKIAINHPDGFAKPGMPADAEIIADAPEKPSQK